MDKQPEVREIPRSEMGCNGVKCVDCAFVTECETASLEGIE